MKHKLVTMLEFVRLVFNYSVISIEDKREIWRLQRDYNCDTGPDELLPTELIMLDLLRAHADFLSQKPELWMFVPCDEDGNVLRDPYSDGVETMASVVPTREELGTYQKAKERCIFEGFALGGLYHGDEYKRGTSIELTYRHLRHESDPLKIWARVWEDGHVTWISEVKTLEDVIKAIK